MTTKTKKCPHCYHAYVINDSYGSYYIGTPIRVCKNCGKNFIDKEFKELALTDVKPWDKLPVSANTAIAVIGVGIMAFAAFKSSWNWFAIILIAIALYLLISDIVGYNGKIQWIEEERRASIKRLSDPQYADFLKELGYDVPDKFLKSTNCGFKE